MEVWAASQIQQGTILISKSPPDVIVAETSDSPGCGIRIADFLKERGLTIPMIALAVHDTPEMRDLADQYGARVFLSKPTTVEVVRQAIDEALAADTAAPAPAAAAQPAVSVVAVAAPVDESDDSLLPAQKQTGTPHILLVDDDPIVRKFLRGVIEQIGVQVIEAKGAMEAWKVLHRQKIDLVVTDLVMEGHSGFDLLRNMRIQKLKTPALVITGHVTDENVAKARKYGAITVLEKSADVTPLKDTVSQVLENLGFAMGSEGDPTAMAGR